MLGNFYKRLGIIKYEEKKHKLKPCPFCGGDAHCQWDCGCITYDGLPCGDKRGEYLRFVFCCKCGSIAFGKHVWNKRIK
jgi:hypothetical protein